MNRNDGGTKPGDLVRASAAAENVIDPGDYWTRSSDQANNYQFTGDKKVVAAAKTTDAPGTVTVGEKDSLWTIASRLVNQSDHKDKSDKFKLDVVKGLVEKNKDTIKTLEANPDKIRGGQVLKIDSVEELAKLGHGKVLNTHYKPPAEREKGSDGTPKNPKDPKDCPPEHRKHHGGRHGREQYAGQPHGDQQYGNQQFNQRPMDLGPVKDIMGMIGMFAGGALMGNRFGHDRHHHRPYYDDYGRGYYDNGNYGGYYGNQQRYPNYTNYRQPGFQGYQPPVSYSHYGHPQQNFASPIHQLQSQFRIQPQQQHHHNWGQHQYTQQQQQQWRQTHPHHRHT